MPKQSSTVKGSLAALVTTTILSSCHVEPSYVHVNLRTPQPRRGPAPREIVHHPPSSIDATAFQDPEQCLTFAATAADSRDEYGWRETTCTSETGPTRSFIHKGTPSRTPKQPFDVHEAVRHFGALRDKDDCTTDKCSKRWFAKDVYEGHSRIYLVGLDNVGRNQYFVLCDFVGRDRDDFRGICYLDGGKDKKPDGFIEGIFRGRLNSQKQDISRCFFETDYLPDCIPFRQPKSHEYKSNEYNLRLTQKILGIRSRSRR